MRILLIITCLITCITYGQNQLKPIISANYSLFLSKENLRVHEVHIGGGVQFNDYFSLQMNLRGLQNERGRHDYYPETDPFRAVTLSLSPSYRILKNRFVSPVIVLDVGTEIWSNAKGKLIDRNYYIRPIYGYPHVLYDRGLFFSKGKLLLDIKLKSFAILLGGSYNLYAFRVNKLSPSTAINGIGYYIGDEFVRYERGFGVEGGLMYTFPTKKKGDIVPE